MEIHEITCNADADTLVTEHIRSVQTGTSLIESLEDKIDEWTEEFDSLDREIKVRNADEMNHFKLNKIIGLYFLIPTASFYVEKWKENLVEKEVPVFSDRNLRDNYTQDDQKLWDDNSLFDSEPE